MDCQEGACSRRCWWCEVSWYTILECCRWRCQKTCEGWGLLRLIIRLLCLALSIYSSAQLVWGVDLVRRVPSGSNCCCDGWLLTGCRWVWLLFPTLQDRVRHRMAINAWWRLGCLWVVGCMIGWLICARYVTSGKLTWSRILLLEFLPLGVHIVLPLPS